MQRKINYLKGAVGLMWGERGGPSTWTRLSTFYCNFLTSIIKRLQVSQKIEEDTEQYYRGIMETLQKVQSGL